MVDDSALIDSVSHPEIIEQSVHFNKQPCSIMRWTIRHHIIIQCKTVAGGNFGEFGKSRAIHQSFTHPNLYHKTAGINSATNQCQANIGEHAWLKIVTTTSTWTLLNPATVYASSSWIPDFLSHRSYARAFQVKHLYICVIPSVMPSLQMPTPF